MGAFWAGLAVAMTAGLIHDKPQPVGLIGLLFATIGYTGFKIFRSALSFHHLAVSVDDTGLWLRARSGQGVIRWDTLAGVAVHWSEPGNRGARHYSIELCPSGPIDRADPVLWVPVRDEEPVRPGLPRPRYRLVTNGSFARYREPLVEAIR
ncbi:hypothetical protein ABZ078_24315 [Streptomyces sp. NPDC006385]|uniref:hypothetical protein n=1 Tax=Streptomyces sp. NPDC006385 TaxID=3156761 RepID=UPI0033A4FD11